MDKLQAHLPPTAKHIAFAYKDINTHICSMLINILAKEHTHDASIEVVNLPLSAVQRTQYYSIGIHPWYIDKANYSKTVEKFYIVASESKCLAIGECGLDKSFESNYNLQKEIFKEQVKAANLFKKPIILYCHKAWNDVLKILDLQKNKVPIIVPMYQVENFELVSKLQKAIKDFYIYFDKSLYLNNNEAIKTLKNISAKNIFIANTDADISIKDIYTTAAKFLNINDTTLQQQILENFYKVFNLENLPL